MGRRRKFTEEEIIEKSKQLFRKKGYHGLAISEIVDTLEVNRASLYETFDNKYNLYVKALEDYIDKGNLFFKELESRDDPAPLVILQYFETVFNLCVLENERRGCFLINATTEMSLNDANIEAIINKANTKFQASLLKIIERGQKDGELRSDISASALVAFIFSLSIGIRVLCYTNSIDSISKEITRMVLYFLAPTDEHSVNILKGSENSLQ